MTNAVAAEILQTERTTEEFNRPNLHLVGGTAVAQSLEYQRQKQLEAHYDAVTQFSELVDGSMLTSFELQSDGQELYGPDGRALSEVADKAEVDAHRIVKQNPELGFELRRRRLESEEIKLARQMAKGELPNTMIIISDFPAELVDARKDVGGYNVTRQQAMMRILTRLPNGNVQMYSKSLDGSNRQALESIYGDRSLKPQAGELLGQRIHEDLTPAEQTVLADRLTGVYDRSMAEQFGGKWYAGRRPADYRNTYDFVCAQHDLIGEFVKLKDRGELNQTVMYDMAATMQKRFEGAKQGVTSLMPRVVNAEPTMLRQEMRLAGSEARQRGDNFSACGETLKADGRNASTEDLMGEAGYGNKTDKKDDDEDEFGSLTFECGKGHKNTRPRHKLIDNCRHCGISVKC